MLKDEDIKLINKLYDNNKKLFKEFENDMTTVLLYLLYEKKYKDKIK